MFKILSYPAPSPLLIRIFSKAFILGFSCVGFLAVNKSFATLPNALSEQDIKTLNRNLVMPSVHRAWTAHGVPSTGPLGIDLGLDATFAFRRNSLDLGSKEGSLAPVIPVPKLWGASQLPWDLKISASFSPAAIYNGLASYGGAAQWNFWTADSGDVFASLLGGYTYTDLFREFSASTISLYSQISKDLQSWQPYSGAGVLVTNGTAKAGKVANNVKKGPHTSASMHLFVGARINMLAKFSFQLDIIATRPSFAMLLEHPF